MKKNIEPSGLYEQIYEGEQKRRVAAAESEARSIEAARKTAAKGRRRTIARALSTFLLVMVVFVLMFAVIYKFMFVISDLTVVGNERYSAERIIDAAGVSTGDNLYSFSSRVVGERLRRVCPYVKSLTVKREVPNSITFTVEEYKPKYYSFIYGQRVILSDDLTVLEIGRETEKCEELCYLELPAVADATCGTKLEFRSELDQSHIYSAVQSVNASELSDRISAMLLTNTYQLKMECDRKYLLNFGTFADCDMRLRVAAAVLKDDMFKTENKMRLDLTKNSETTVIVDNTLEFH